MSRITEKLLRMSTVTSWGSNYIRYWPPHFNIKGIYLTLSLVILDLCLSLGYFCLMDDLYELSDADIHQPPWLAEYVQIEFAEYFYHYEDEFDFHDYIYPIEPDGVTRFLFDSHLCEILTLQTSDEVQTIEDYLRSIDHLQKDYIPSKHLQDLRYMVSVSFYFNFCNVVYF